MRRGTYAELLGDIWALLGAATALYTHSRPYGLDQPGRAFSAARRNAAVRRGCQELLDRAGETPDSLREALARLCSEAFARRALRDLPEGLR